eukprot:14257916-Heterocapsa_arctica.AAC.1
MSKVLGGERGRGEFIANPDPRKALDDQGARGHGRRPTAAATTGSRHGGRDEGGDKVGVHQEENPAQVHRQDAGRMAGGRKGQRD